MKTKYYRHKSPPDLQGVEILKLVHKKPAMVFDAATNSWHKSLFKSKEIISGEYHREITLEEAISYQPTAFKK